MTRAREIADLLAGVTITTDDNTAQLTLKSTDADASVGPRLDLIRDSGSPADGDTLGRMRFMFDNDAAEETEGVRFDVVLDDASDGTEDVKLIEKTMINGSLVERVRYVATETVFNDDSVDVDFRVESNGNANMLFVDAGNDRIGIGNASPAHNLDVTQTGSTSARVGATGSSGDNDGTLIINNGGSGDAMLRFDYEGNADRARIGVSSSGQQLKFFTNGNNERMRVDELGNFFINNTTADSNDFNQGLIIYGNNQGGGVGGVIRGNNEHALVIGRSNSNGGIVLFRRDSSGVGSISVTASATAYNTSSDYRLKTAITYDFDATTRLKQLKPARFKWIVDGDDAEFVDGFLANEAQTVVPEAVTGTKDEVDADGNPVYQGIDQSKLVPLLTKALIESVSKIEALEARITALEAG